LHIFKLDNLYSPVQEGLLAAVVFDVLHQFPNRSILERGQKVKVFGLGCDPKL